MEQMAENGKLLKFTLPDMKNWVEIREQNGADDDLLSNVGRAENMMNLCDFIASIVVKTNITTTGRLTPEQVSSMPILNKYLILFKSRIHSLGNVVNFNFTWPDGLEESYEENLYQLIFSDYSELPSPEEMVEKPYALPYYISETDELGYMSYITSSGKEYRFKHMDTDSEKWLMERGNNYSKNDALKARGLQLKDGEKWVTVQSFHVFSARDMMEIRKFVFENDPEFTGSVEIVSSKGQKTFYSVLMAPSFFYPGEI